MSVESIFEKNHRLFVIAGPCVIESEEVVFRTAERLQEICSALDLFYIFKSSYDKANRSSITSYRGPGMEKGLTILSKVKERFDLPVLTDVHSPGEAHSAAEVVDVIQIPAFLSRQTDMILAAGETGKTVNIKKGQFLAPWELKNVIDKFTSTGNYNVTLTERGTMFGYNNLVVDFRTFPIMKTFGYPIVFDVTHSLQLPGGLGSSSGGQPEFAFPLARAAIAAGADGIFMEVHPNPDDALCDGPNMLQLDHIEALLGSLKDIHGALQRNE